MIARNPDYEWGEIVPPWLYARAVLGLDPYPWQDELFDAVGQRIPCSIAAANEAGKTTYGAAPLILWFLDQFGQRGGKVVVTSGSWLQLTTQFAPALRRWKHLYPKWEWNDTSIRIPNSPADYGMVMFSTDSPGRAEGHHAIDDATAPLFIIADEAKSIPDGIFTAFDRCRPQYLLLMSSPGQSSGKFYRTHAKERAHYWTRRVTSRDCPHIPEEKRARDAAIYGESSMLYQSMHEAQFTDLDDRMVCAPSKLRALIAEPPAPMVGTRVAFCDFAAGGDENVLAIRDGNRVTIAAAWREEDTHAAALRFIELFKHHRLSPHQVFGDEGGIGRNFIYEMKADGWSINPVNFGAPALDSHYFNRASEMWHLAARAIERREVIIEDDPVLFEQLTTRRQELKNGGRLGVESKEAMRERGIGSPDRADAVAGAIACGPSMLGAVVSTAGIRVARPTFARPVFSSRR